MRLALALSVCLTLAACGGGGFVTEARAGDTAAAPASQPYANPLPLRTVEGGTVESCPDPSIIRGQKPGDDNWYLYCTNEKFSDSGTLHLLPIFRSADLVNWTYAGDVFDAMPTWVASNGGLWAPDIQFFNGKYYLYYSVSNTQQGGAAIFVATSSNPTGPWVASPVPVVAPGEAPCCAGIARATIDSEIVQDGNQRYIFYGSFNGGISARALTSNGLQSIPSTQVQITVPDRYEAAYVVKRGGYFYLMVSAGSCCTGPSSGYGVYVARSLSPLGPYIDKDGNSLLDARVGGTPVLLMNGNRWLGPGHNAVATDASGQDWMIYHAVDAARPYFENGWTRRPLMLDRMDWVDGWPRVRGGLGASDDRQQGPSMRSTSAAGPMPAPLPEPDGTLLPEFSDEFDSADMRTQWNWLRGPAHGTADVIEGRFRFDTQAGDIYFGRQDAAALTRPAPAGDYMIEVKLATTVPVAGSFNFVQGGLAVLAPDGSFVKLTSVAINDTRQIEFAKQSTPVAGTSAEYASTFLASPADDTYLRLVRRASSSGQELYTAYSSHDGVTWEPGATWRQSLGQGTSIGLVSMGGAGFTTLFDYVRVYALVK